MCSFAHTAKLMLLSQPQTLSLWAQYHSTIHSIVKCWYTEYQFSSNSKLRSWTALMLGHLTLEPVKCIKYQGYQQSHMCGSQGTHVFSWGLFHSCRRSVRTPQWQHSTTVQRKRKPSLDWWFHHMAMCSANQLLLYPTTPQPRSEQGRHLRVSYCWRLHQPLLIDPGDGLTAVSAPLPLQGLQEEATATRELVTQYVGKGWSCLHVFSMGWVHDCFPTLDILLEPQTVPQQIYTPMAHSTDEEGEQSS